MKSKYKPSSYFPFFGNDFFQALEGYPDSVVVGYLRAIWHYWHHLHCDGLPDDDEYLRRVCRCLISDWVRTKGVLFDNDKFFRLDGGKWHQRRALEEYKRSMEIYTKRLNSITNARKYSPNIRPYTTPDSISDIIRDSIPSLSPHSSPSPSGSNKQTNNGSPTLKDVLAVASMTGMLEADATEFWNHFESSGWIDKNGHSIVNWRAKMATWKTVARSASFDASGKSGKPRTTLELKTIIESKNSLAAQIRTKHCSDAAMGSHWDDEAEKEHYFKLKRDAKKLQEQLANMA